RVPGCGTGATIPRLGAGYSPGDQRPRSDPCRRPPRGPPRAAHRHACRAFGDAGVAVLAAAALPTESSSSGTVLGPSRPTESGRLQLPPIGIVGSFRAARLY